MTSEFLLQRLDHLGTMLGLALGLLGIEADDIAPTALPIAHDHLFGEEVILDRAIAPRAAEHLGLDLGDGAHWHGEHILAYATGKLLAVRLGVHPGIGDEEG